MRVLKSFNQKVRKEKYKYKNQKGENKSKQHGRTSPTKI